MTARRPRVSFVAALAQNRVIGVDGRLPWHLPADMRRFREITMGYPVLMGRKTYESIPARFRPLPGRHNVVLTRQPDYEAPGCTVAHSLDEAWARLAGAEEVMVIGGAALFAALLPVADRLYLTLVQAPFDGDVLFPELEQGVWCERGREEHAADAEHAVPFTFVILERC